MLSRTSDCTHHDYLDGRPLVDAKLYPEELLPVYKTSLLKNGEVMGYPGYDSNPLYQMNQGSFDEYSWPCGLDALVGTMVVRFLPRLLPSRMVPSAPSIVSRTFSARASGHWPPPVGMESSGGHSSFSDRPSFGWEAA